ncbi:MAG TPA: cyclic nucleotide-binding domain-containing protein [Candidatus Limnocylindrales bacterium]|nr:cyclic nucleotide-binding domain-containing protein [Candidatus Limnocylindrales bacterium]
MTPDPLAFGPFMLLEPSARERLAQASAMTKVPQGDVLIEEREDDDDAYLLLEGSVRVISRSESRSDSRTLALIGAPALLGEMAVVNREQRNATVVADTPCSLLRIPGKELRRAMEKQPLFSSAMRERADLLLADAFLKRKSPIRDLPAEIVGALAARLRPRELQPDQLIQGSADDLYLVRRGAIEDLGDGARTLPGDFVQRGPADRYAAVGETWIYELRMADVASEIIKHQERVRAIAARLVEGAKVRVAPGVTAIADEELGGALVRDASHRAVVSEHVAALLPRLDGANDIAALVRASGRTRGEVVEGLSMLIAAGLAEIRA